ncbi:uncharacterized protein LOC134217138 [Armigeres subalbatus]|uniref:uncharacterized protein LOC134217138 n=1 Tax=Armigeres subalbatus TaxID=124917 RepID=UPI002ED5E3EE
MSGPKTIFSLPTEVLEIILQNLDWYDLQSAMLVCKWWGATAFVVRSNAVRLNIVPFVRCDEYQDYKLENYHQTLLLSRRSYKHIAVYWGNWEKCHKTDQVKDQMILDIINRFQQTLVSLKIISRKYNMASWVLLDLLRSCTNLKILNLNEMQVESLRFSVNESFRTRIHTLYDSRQLIRSISRAPNLFANVTTLHVKITPSNKLTGLFHKLSPQLVNLTLGWDLDWPDHQHDILPMENFPRLETLATPSFGSISHLGRFLRNIPKLRMLILFLQQDGDTSVLRWVNQEHLRHLVLWPQVLTAKKFAHITRFSSLESLTIRGCYADVPNKLLQDAPVLQNVKRLAIKEHGWPLFSNDLLKYFNNLTELELHANKNWNSSDAQNLNGVTSLKRLIIHEGLDALEGFMEFCAVLTIPDLTLITQETIFNETKSFKLSIQAPYIRKLSVYAYMIDSILYEPMLESMPNLRRLELTLQIPCDDDTYKRISQKFPSCDTVRKYFRRYDSAFDVYERLLQKEVVAPKCALQ